jgi:hypothetical protein
MTNTEAANGKFELAQRHIADQRRRIARYKELIVELERDNKQGLLPAARVLLSDLEHALAAMMVEQARARDELEKADSEPKKRAGISTLTRPATSKRKANRHS